VGTYTITFTPTKKGEHLVSVRVGGGEIEHSPLRVPVRSSRLDLGLPEKVLVNKEWAWGVACGRGDRLVYITENYGHRVSVWDKDGNAVRTVGQKGQKSGQIFHPRGIAVSRNGNIYVADGKDVGRIQKLSKTGQHLAHYTELNEPHGVALNRAEDRVYVCESGAQHVAVFDTDLQFIESFGDLSCSLEDGYQATAATSLESPHSVALDDAGNIYVTDTMGQHVHVYDKTGAHLRSVGHPHDDEFAPSGIAIEDRHMFVADRGGNQVVVLTLAGEFVMATGSYGTAKGQFQNPSGLAIDLDGYLYVCDYGNSRVQVF
jgi:DNA-binding beta-propeller fold protein YncE